MYIEIGHYQCCSFCCCGAVYDNSSVWSCWQFSLLSHFYLLQSHLLQEANFWLWTVMNVYLEWQTAFWAAVNVPFHSAANTSVVWYLSRIEHVYIITHKCTITIILHVQAHNYRHPKYTWYYSDCYSLCLAPCNHIQKERLKDYSLELSLWGLLQNNTLL